MARPAKKIARKVQQKLSDIQPVRVHHTGAGVVQLECPYGASEAFRTSSMAMRMKKRHEQKWRHRKRLCRLFKGM
jgi:hypothetical protein